MPQILSGFLALAAFVGAVGAAPALAAPPATLTLTGVLTGADHQTYREIPFRVPAGTTAVRVDFAYTGREQKSVIDLGLRDPQRFRGWSGGNKAAFTVTETWATPSYLPGPLTPGTWALILGVPNLRKDGRAAWTAHVTLESTPVFHGFAEAPLKAGPGWYRGDLHLHTQHSDGSCDSRSGRRTPCPLFRTLEAAAARGLDFVAVTEHNTPAHFQDLAELQGYFDDLLLIPGREVTTFHGHMNVLGMTTPLDFQLGSARAPTLDRILDVAQAARALVSINHPGLPSGEACMGCGWTAQTDWTRIPAMEVINGAQSRGPLSGRAAWRAQLDAGRRITALGGSDNHDAALDPGRPGAVGYPTTVVRAENLSQDAILDGLRAGHAFIDAKGTRDRLLEVTAAAQGRAAGMGDALTAPDGMAVTLSVRVAHADGGVVRVEAGGAPLTAPVRGDDATLTFTVPARAGYILTEVTAPDGDPWLLGNPVYIRAASPR